MAEHGVGTRQSFPRQRFALRFFLTRTLSEPNTHNTYYRIAKKGPSSEKESRGCSFSGLILFLILISVFFIEKYCCDCSRALNAAPSKP